MYSFSYLEPVCCSTSSSNCCFLTCIQISQRQVRWSGIPISLRIFHSLLPSTQSKDFGIVNKAKIDVFLELSCFFHDPADVGNLISGSSAFSKTSLNIWKLTVHLLLKSTGVLNSKSVFSRENINIFLPFCQSNKLIP